LERVDQERREQAISKINYMRESDVPFAPRDDKIATNSANAALIPLFNVKARKAAPPVAEQPMTMSLPFMPIQPITPTPQQPLLNPMNPLNQINPMVPMPPMNPMGQMNSMNSMNPLAMLNFMMPPSSQFPVYMPRAIYGRTNQKPINYRTEPCRNFHSTIGCTHGDNCHFIHDYDYPGIPIPDLEKWRRTNQTRQQNIKAMQSMSMNMATYYPPAAPDAYYKQYQQNN
jgi:hypothetical protein